MIIGATRATRFADKPANWIFELARKERPDWEVELVDIRDFDLPFFNEKATNLWMPSEDQRAVAWQNKLAGFDAFIFVTAEYNRSVPASLKNALDQAYKEWNRKPAAIVAYGSAGGARAAEHLRTIAIELQMVPTRYGVHIMGADFMKVHPMGENAAISDHRGSHPARRQGDARRPRLVDPHHHGRPRCNRAGGLTAFAAEALLRPQPDPRKPLDVSVAREQVRGVLASGRISDRVRRGELMPLGELRRRKRDRGVETTQVRVKAVTLSAAFSPTSRVSHFASSTCTMVGTSHSPGSGNSVATPCPYADAFSHSIHAKVSTSRIALGVGGAAWRSRHLEATFDPDAWILQDVENLNAKVFEVRL